MSTNTEHYRLIEIAAELANCRALRSFDGVQDWPARNIGRQRVLQMIEHADARLKDLALDVRDAADTQAREIARLRQAIDKVVRENHAPSTGIVALHIVAGEVA